MSIWKAVILGLVQGFTEFLPVSSSGHLVLMKQILGVDLESGGMFFDVMLHFGTLMAIIVAFLNDIQHLFTEGINICKDVGANIGIYFSGNPGKTKTYYKIVRSSYRKYVLLLLVSTIPTGIIGILLADLVEVSNEMVLVPACCLLITSVFLLIADLVEPGEKKPKDVSYASAVLIGIAQGVSALPGVSRAGTTITACLLCGFDKRFALRYSFIMSIPAVLGAVVVEIIKMPALALSQLDIVCCIVATLIAAISGYLAIRFMMALIRNKGFKGFSIYCAVAGAAALIWYFV